MAHRVPVLRCCGYTQVKYIFEVRMFISIFSHFFSFFLIFFWSKNFRAEFQTPPNVTIAKAHLCGLALLVLFLLLIVPQMKKILNNLIPRKIHSNILWTIWPTSGGLEIGKGWR